MDCEERAKEKKLKKPHANMCFALIAPSLEREILALPGEALVVRESPSPRRSIAGLAGWLDGWNRPRVAAVRLLLWLTPLVVPLRRPTRDDAHTPPWPRDYRG